MEYSETLLDIADYYPLYLETGWNEILGLNKQQIDDAIHNSFATISVYKQSRMIGFGRVISDGSVYAGIYNVRVTPDFNIKASALKSSEYLSLSAFQAISTVFIYLLQKALSRFVKSLALLRGPLMHKE